MAQKPRNSNESENVPRGTGAKKPDDDEIDPLESALAEIGVDSDVVAHVFKFQDGREVGLSNAGSALCLKCPASEFDPVGLRDEYGPGTYRVQFKRGGRIVRAAQFRLAAPVRPPKAETKPEAGGIDLMALLIEDRQRAAEFQSQLMLALVQGMQGGGNGVDARALIEVFREGRESATAPTPPHEAVKDFMALGLDLAKTASSGSEGGTVLERLAPRILDIIERAGNGPQPAALPAGRVAPTPTQSGPASQPSAQPPGDPSIETLVAQWAPALIAEAQAQRDPYVFGQFVIERATETGRELLRQLAFLPDDKRNEVFAQIAPQAIPYARWLDGVAHGIRDWYTPDDEAPEGPEAPSGPRAVDDGGADGAVPPDTAAAG